MIEVVTDPLFVLAFIAGIVVGAGVIILMTLTLPD